MRFLVDTQLPVSMARALQVQGHQAEHVLDLNLAQSPDGDLRKYALAHQAVIITKDEDFADWIERGQLSPCILWLRIGNCTNAQLLTWFLPLLPEAIKLVETGDKLVEMR